MLAWGLNEEELVEAFLDRAVALLDASVEDWEIVFVDDGSTDAMPSILAAYSAKEPRLRVVTNERNLNIGASCRRAISMARKDFLFWQTVDWSYDISELRRYLELLRHYDVVQGIRPTPIRLLSYIPILRSIYRVKRRSDTLRKAVVSLANYYLLRLLFGVPFQDFQNVTFYPARLIQSVELTGDSSFINPECLIRTFEKGARFLEVPIPFNPRTAGEAKGTKLKSILRSVRDITRNWIQWGWKLRLRKLPRENHQIARVSDPFRLNTDVLGLVVPLFRYFR